MAYQSAEAAKTLAAATMGGGSSSAPSQGGSVRQATNNALGGAQPLQPAPQSGGSSGMDKFFDMLGAGGAAYQMSGAEFGASQERRAEKKDAVRKEANRKDLFKAKSLLDRGDKQGLMSHLESRIYGGEKLGLDMKDTRLIHTAALNDPTFVKAANLINDSFNYLVATDKIKPLGLTEQQKISNKMSREKLDISIAAARAAAEEKAAKNKQRTNPSANVMKNVSTAFESLQAPNSGGEPQNIFNQFANPADQGNMKRFIAATYEQNLQDGQRSDQAMTNAIDLSLTGVEGLTDNVFSKDEFAFTSPTLNSSQGTGNQGGSKVQNPNELTNIKRVPQP